MQTKPRVMLLDVDGNGLAVVDRCVMAAHAAKWSPVVIDTMIDLLADATAEGGYRGLLAEALELFEVTGINDGIEFNADHPLFRFI